MYSYINTNIECVFYNTLEYGFCDLHLLYRLCVFCFAAKITFKTIIWKSRSNYYQSLDVQNSVYFKPFDNYYFDFGLELPKRTDNPEGSFGANTRTKRLVHILILHPTYEWKYAYLSSYFWSKRSKTFTSLRYIKMQHPEKYVIDGLVLR